MEKWSTLIKLTKNAQTFFLNVFQLSSCGRYFYQHSQRVALLRHFSEPEINVSAAVGVVLSTTLLVLNAYTKNYDLGELAQKHKQAANEIWLIREQYLSLLVDLAMGQKSLEALQTERDKLLSALHSVYAGSPSTTYAAYKKAQDALKRNEDMTFSDQEINAFLPTELKRG